MTSNTPETQALEPVTQADRELAIALFEAGLLKSPLGASAPDDMVVARWRKGILGEGDHALQVIARHRQSSSNAGGVGVEARETVARVLWDQLRNKMRGRKGGRSMPHWDTAHPDEHAPYLADADAVLASLSTLTMPPTPHEFVKNPLIPFPSCQVCMGPENAEAHSPPTPDRIGKDAVREALLETALRNVNDRVAQYGSEALGRAVNDIVNAALSATPAQEGEGERCQKCGLSNSSWSAPSPLWNAVMRGGSIDGEPLFGDMVCASCFMELAEQAGIASNWRVDAQRVNVPLETTTPTGREWDADQWLWMHPSKASTAQPVDETERLREALEDTMSTLSAVKAEAIVDGGGTCLWIAEKLNQQMIDNRAALTDTKGDRPMGDR